MIIDVYNFILFTFIYNNNNNNNIYRTWIGGLEVKTKDRLNKREGMTREVILDRNANFFFFSEALSYFFLGQQNFID